MTYRPHMPLSVKLEAAVRQLGLDPASVDFDHDPALGLREFDEETKTYSPDANDPRYITVRSRDDDHRIKTSGTKATTAGSDIHRIAKTKRLAKARAELDQALQAKVTGEHVKKTPSRLRSVGFQRREKQNTASRPIRKWSPAIEADQ